LPLQAPRNRIPSIPLHLTTSVGPLFYPFLSPFLHSLSTPAQHLRPLTSLRQLTSLRSSLTVFTDGSSTLPRSSSLGHAQANLAPDGDRTTAHVTSPLPLVVSPPLAPVASPPPPVKSPPPPPVKFPPPPAPVSSPPPPIKSPL
jgi:hypothetical protein